MEYIRITKENIDKEHICCAMSGKQYNGSLVKTTLEEIIVNTF